METQHLSVTKATGEVYVIEVPLESIHLGGLGMKGVSLDSLEGLERLRTLWLYHNNIECIDLSPLSAAQNLCSLSLSSNRLRVVDLSPLANCQLLAEVDLSGNELSHVDLGPLGMLGALEVLNLNGNSFREIDLSPIEHCKSLRVLNLSSQPFSGRSPVRGECTRNASEHLQLDITPLLLSSSLQSALMPPDAKLNADPSLKHVAGSRATKARRVVKSAPDSSPTPTMKWLGPDIIRRITWPQYEMLFKEIGSREVITRLHRILGSASGVYSFHLQKGMMEGFGMEWLSGVDSNPEELLIGLSPDEKWSSARSSVMARALEILGAQVSRGGSTLFIGVDKLVEHNRSDLAALIAEKRANEIQDAAVIDHGEYVDISRLMLSAYGLAMMDALSIDSPVISPHQFDRLSRGLEEAGFRVKTVSVEHARRSTGERPKCSMSLLKFVFEDRVSGSDENQQNRE